MKIKTFQFYSLEAKLFFLFSLLNLIPVFLIKYYVSIDAPLHLYQSNVIVELWKSNELFEQFFRFNPVIVGNLTSQFILAFFNFVFPAWIAEKILLTIYILGLVFSFRYLVTGINKKFSYIGFLIFPFTYNAFFSFGHYNYVFGILFMLLLFGYWVRVENNLNFYKVIVLCLLFILLFLSHIFVYTFFVGSFGLYLLFSLFISLKKEFALRLFFKKTTSVFFAIIPSLILWVIYSNSISGEIKLSRLSVSNLINDLVNIRPLIGYEYSIERIENNYLFILLCILFLYVIINRIFLYRKSNVALYNTSNSNFRLINPTDFWLLLTFIFLLFYFIIPDKLTAGNISTRLNILLFIFFIIWLSLQQFSKVISAITLVIIIVYSINIRVIQNKYLSGLDRDIKEVNELIKYIDPNTIYYPINIHPNWIKVHFLNYVGVNGPYVSAQLPNCSGTFPIIDTRDKLPVVMLGDVDLAKFCYWCSNLDKSHPEKIVDYVIVGGAAIFASSDNYDDIKTTLNKNYNLIYTSNDKNIELYKVKYEYSKH